MPTTTNIRASMFPGYADCARRAAAKQYRAEVESAGFTLRQTLPSIGASVGTAAHLVAKRHWQAILAGQEPNQARAMDEAMTGLQEEITPGCIWDDTTPSLDAARFQLDRIVRAYIMGTARGVRPLAVELSLRADAGDGFTLTGHIDLVASWPAPDAPAAWIRDLKTGATARNVYQAQLGGYALLYRSLPEALPVGAVGVDWIRRTPRTRPQDQGQRFDYEAGACERAGWAMIQRIKSDLLEFRSTSNPWAFMANAASMMCGPKYCPAHGTDFCEMGTCGLEPRNTTAV